MRTIFPVKYYNDEGFIERRIELDDADVEDIIRDWLYTNAEFDLDEVEIENLRGVSIWLHAKCRKYLDPDEPEREQLIDAEVQISGKYDGNPAPGR